MKLLLSIKDGKAIVTEGTHKHIVNEILKNYVIKDYFSGHSCYSNQYSYFLVTDDDQILEIPMYGPINKNKVDITHRTYKKIVVDNIFGDEARIICKETLEGFNIVKKADDYEYWIKTNKELNNVYSKAKIIDKMNDNKKEIAKYNKMNEILEYFKDNIEVNKGDHFYLFRKRLVFKKNNIKVGKLLLKYDMSIDEIEQKIKRYIIKESI